MYSGADWYLTYGFIPFIVELDEEAKLPRIRIENPIGAYPEFDRYGRCVAFAKRYTLTLGELVSQFPEYDNILLGGMGYKQDLNGQIEMIRYYDKDQSVVYVPARDLAEVMAPLPSFNCSATNMVSDTQRRAADTRTRIANYYVTSSDLQIQMYQGACGRR